MKRRGGRLALAFMLMAGQALAGDKKDGLVVAQGEVPEARLVDVAIDLFSPGVSDTPASPLLQQGIRTAVRKSEARYVPIHLRNTLQSTGQWGEVRVVPGGASWAELLVTGRIEKSNGKDLELEIAGARCRGPRLARAQRTSRPPTPRPTRRTGRSTGATRSRRSTTASPTTCCASATGASPRSSRPRARWPRLRFAAEMSADPYASYLATDGKGRSSVVRLPAADDPMMLRIGAIRERDHMFVDTLNEFYNDFYARMDRPYDDWRAYSYEEQKALDSVNRSSRLMKILGGIAVLGGILMDPRGSDYGTKDVLILGGIAAINAGFEKGKDAGIHKAALGELADSFEGELTPLLVDVDGKVVQLTGSAEVQFNKWRELLHEIAATDAPLPADINVMPMAPERGREALSVARRAMNGPEPGLEILPGLTLLRRLGRGGMGEAWLARDAERGIDVVAKLLPGGRAPGAPRAPAPRGAARAQARSPAHRPGVRLPLGRALLGRDPAPHAGRRRGRAARGGPGRDRPPGSRRGRRARLSPRPRRRAPRRQGLERAARRRGPRPPRGLRHRLGGARGRGRDRRPRRRLAGQHEPAAARGRDAACPRTTSTRSACCSSSCCRERRRRSTHGPGRRLRAGSA